MPSHEKTDHVDPPLASPETTVSADAPPAKGERAFGRRPLLHALLATGTAGMAGTTFLGTPVAEAAPPRALLTPLRNPGNPAAGNKSTDDYVPLQETIDTALEIMNLYDFLEVTIDLRGHAYRFNTPLLIEPLIAETAPKTRLRIVNGTLLSSVGNNEQHAFNAIHIKPHGSAGSYSDYPEITFDNVRLEKLQYQNVTGMLIERGLRCTFLNCAIEPQNNGSTGAFDRGLVLQGCQICAFIDCHFGGNNHHLVFEQLSGSPSTDCRFYSCSFTESNQAAILSEEDSFRSGVTAAQCLFDGCTIETARNGPLVDMWDTRNTKFHRCRFENDENGYNLVQLGRSAPATESTTARFCDCNFSASSSSASPAVSCLYGGADVEDTALIANVFPSPSTIPAVDLAGTYRAVANKNLTDA
jgi:hypothetical protein